MTSTFFFLTSTFFFIIDIPFKRKRAAKGVGTLVMGGGREAVILWGANHKIEEFVSPRGGGTGKGHFGLQISSNSDTDSVCDSQRAGSDQRGADVFLLVAGAVQ
jgi:hypothetical protein